MMRKMKFSPSVGFLFDVMTCKPRWLLASIGGNIEKLFLFMSPNLNSSAYPSDGRLNKNVAQQVVTKIKNGKLRNHWAMQSILYPPRLLKGGQDIGADCASILVSNFSCPQEIQNWNSNYGGLADIGFLSRRRLRLLRKLIRKIVFCGKRYYSNRESPSNAMEYKTFLTHWVK